MGNEETVKYFVCSVKGGRHCDKEPGSGNQRLEVGVSNDCPTNGKSFISLKLGLLTDLKIVRLK